MIVHKFKDKKPGNGTIDNLKEVNIARDDK